MADLTPERLQELRRIAEAATPGPWRISDDGPADRFVIASADREHIAETTQGGSFTNEDLANAHHIATFDPATALALLDEIDHLRKQRDTLLSGISRIADEVLALLDRIEELEAVLRLVYDEFVLDVARWCRHCRLRIDDHAPECPMAEVERVLGLAGGATDA